ncbi:MAG: hypothetical protein CHACPFDD_00303 [Phycisphaerae bacterium]|nr:hypothetical protein [Phycisphaerae bacterium]
MKRNLLLTACSAGVLIALFVAYSKLVRDPAIESSQRQDIIETVPTAAEISPQQSMQGAAGDQNVVIPPGGGAGITLYDERTGEATHNLRYEEWRPGSEGSRDEVWVKSPVLTFLLPSGMVATVSADEGEITVDRLQKSRAGWKFGWLRGDATIILDRGARRIRSSTQPHDDDVITVRMSEVFFDLDLGQLRCDERVAVSSADFDIAGSGLDLVWNQAANRVEQLTIAHGDKLVLYSMADFFDVSPTTQPVTPEAVAANGVAAGRDAAPAGDVTTQPAVRKLKSHRQRPEKVQTGYLCALTGDVRVRQLRGDEVVSSLDAEMLRLMFDLGAGGGLNLARGTSRPARRGDGHIEVQWSGPLTMSPLPPPEPKSGAPGAGLIVLPPRRRVEALGTDVVLTRGEARIHCGGLEYHDESGRVWLRRGEHACVTLDAGAERSLTASGVFIDRKRDLITLIGDVRLRARRKRPDVVPPDAAGLPAADMTIACAQIAEITLHDWEGDGAASAGLGGALRTARFVGDVHVDFGKQTLNAHELTMTFDRAADGDTFEQRLRGAQASGGVYLSAEHDAVECAWLDLTFAVDTAGDIYPSEFDGRGAVRITRGSSRLTGRRVVAALEPATGEPRSRGERLALRTVRVEGGAELIDPERKIGARGATILAWMEGENRLARANVRGGRGELAIVHARPYTVRGESIELRMREQTLHVDGASRLAFLSRNGLQGERRDRPTKVTVAARQTLHIDGRQNVIRMVGGVEARSGSESLNADEITLTLRDADPPPATAPAGGALGQWVSDLSGLLQADGAARATDPFEGEGGGRKEPIRLTAINALAKTESFESGASEPIVHSSLEAPHLDIDLVQRQIQTVGYTTLLLTDYRIEARRAGDRPESEMVPSDLMSGGPSQTVLKCDRGLTYLLGEEAGGRRDSVLLEGGVKLVHLAGREVVPPAEAGAFAGHDTEQLAKLRARYTTLDCDRLECAFGRRDDAKRAAPAGGALAPGARLTWLNAGGDVQLTDRQDEMRTEVYADRLNFDHSTGRVTVFGTPQSDARVYRFNQATGIVDRPYAGKRLSIDLINNTVQGDVSGEVRQARP